MIRALCIALFAIFLATGAIAAPAGLSNPKLEARAVALQKELRCVVCQGESLDESKAPLAADLRHLIRQRIAAGDSDEAVKRFLVARYGEFILMKPRMENETYLLWFAPLIFLALGGAVVAFVMIGARGRLLAGETRAKGDRILVNRQ